MVCANGAIVWDARCDEVIHQTSFDPSFLAVAVHRLREFLPEAGIALLSARMMFLDETYMSLRHKGAEDARVFSDLDLVLSRQRIAMVAVRHPRLGADQVLGLTAAAFDGIGLASIAGASVDIVPGTTKAIAVAKEMAYLGCAAEATIVFGDMPNDLPLFAWAGRAYAVANGHPAVLAAADEIVPSNDEDGVARTVHHTLSLEWRTS